MLGLKPEVDGQSTSPSGINLIAFLLSYGLETFCISKPESRMKMKKKGKQVKEFSPDKPSYFQWSRTLGALMTARENGRRCGKSLQYPLKLMGGGDQNYGERLFAMFGQETMNI